MALTYPLPSPQPAWALGSGYRTLVFYYIKRKSASADSPGTPFFSAMASSERGTADLVVSKEGLVRLYCKEGRGLPARSAHGHMRLRQPCEQPPKISGFVKMTSRCCRRLYKECAYKSIVRSRKHEPKANKAAARARWLEEGWVEYSMRLKQDAECRELRQISDERRLSFTRGLKVLSLIHI